ncbi:MAG: hypothetical protein DMF99_20805 [Acidobacteria bacterium]|nr:MAG: hypothetical protein DMG03_06475 [Acidobacteriota bacterium]PYR07984.1 MAG: hypothetical protein DMF99_20805 [Acidobacteriota bacterium]
MTRSSLFGNHVGVRFVAPERRSNEIRRRKCTKRMPAWAGEDGIRVAPIVEAVNRKSSTLTRWKFVSGVFDRHSTRRDEAGIGVAKVQKLTA